MNSATVNRIKRLCREQGTSLTKLELEFGWGNGTIGKWAKMKNSPPVDRLRRVAERLNVTVNVLLGDDMRFADELAELVSELKEEEYSEAIDLLKNRKNEKKPALKEDESKIADLLDKMDRAQLLDIIARATEILKDK